MITKAIKESLDIPRTIGRAEGFEALPIVLLPLFIDVVTFLVVVITYWIAWELPNDMMLVFRITVLMVFFYWIPASIINYIYNNLNN